MTGPDPLDGKRSSSLVHKLAFRETVLSPANILLELCYRVHFKGKPVKNFTLPKTTDHRFATLQSVKSGGQHGPNSISSGSFVRLEAVSFHRFGHYLFWIFWFTGR